MTCHVLDRDTFTGSMYEKLIWICAFMAVGTAHPGKVRLGFRVQGSEFWVKGLVL
jgi:hypothetical protein